MPQIQSALASQKKGNMIKAQSVKQVKIPRLDDGVEFEVRFRSLRNGGEVLRFACDRTGLADMDSMDQMTLNRYLYARALLGKDFRLEIAPTE